MYLKDTLILQDKNYISAKRASVIFGYTSDYVGQLCRLGKLECQMIGRTWFVSEESIINHQKSVALDLSSKDTSGNLSDLSNVASSVISTIPVSPVASIVSSCVDAKTDLVIGTTLLKSDVQIGQASAISHVSDFRKFTVASVFLVFVFLFVLEFSTGMSSKVASIIKDIASSNSENLSKVDKPPPNLNTEASAFGGLAVIPSTKSIEGDEKIKKKISDSFSDQVEIKPDSSRTAGVITPVFRQVKGDDFVYVMVPIKN